MAYQTLPGQLIIGKDGRMSFEIGLSGGLNGHSAASHAADFSGSDSEGSTVPIKDGKIKKKRTRDPNAPKRVMNEKQKAAFEKMRAGLAKKRAEKAAAKAAAEGAAGATETVCETAAAMQFRDRPRDPIDDA